MMSYILGHSALPHTLCFVRGARRPLFLPTFAKRSVAGRASSGKTTEQGELLVRSLPTSASRPNPNIVLYTPESVAKKLSLPSDQRKTLSASERRRNSTYPPLTRPLPELPPLETVNVAEAPAVEITTLSNGLRVVTQENYKQVASINVLVDSGTEFESDATRGVCHVLEKMSFKSTRTRTTEDLREQLVVLGAHASAGIGREALSYTSQVIRDHVAEAVEILSDTIQNSLFLPDELEMHKQIILYEHEEMATHKHAMIGILHERAHEVAYPTSAIGKTMFCSPDRLPHISQETLFSYIHQNYTPNRMVLSGAGVNHDRLDKLAQHHFGAIPPASSAVSHPHQIWGGGELRISDNKSDSIRLLIAFEGFPLKSKEFYTSCLIQQMLGGGDSFSAGGPGKGMFSRLYAGALRKYNWLQSMHSFNTSYRGTGMLGIYAEAPVNAASAVVDIVCQNFLQIQRVADEHELQRAKNMLKAMIFTGLESRAIHSDDLARQLLFYGREISADEHCAAIDAVTIEDIESAGRRILSGKPVVIVHGPDQVLQTNELGVPAYTIIEHFFRQGVRM